MNELNQIITDLSQEQKDLIRSCKTVQDIMEVVNKENVEISQQDAAIILQLLHLSSNELLDEELQKVQGGRFYPATEGTQCPHCKEGTCTIHGSYSLKELWDSFWN